MDHTLDKILNLMERINKPFHDYLLLTEADSRLKQVNRIIDNVFDKYFNPDNIVNDSEYYVDGNPNTTWRQYLIYHLRHTFNLMTNQDVKYLPVVARLAYSDEVRFDMADDNGRQIQTLQRIVVLLKKDDTLFQEIKNNVNITFGQLLERFKKTFAKEDEEDAKAANEISGGQSDYIVKKVTDFKTANYYGNYSCSSSKLCYTQSESTWNGYTANGMNAAYVCLRHGWEDIPEEPTEGNPYDLYGTSMIFVFIDPDGNISTSNCRWNHCTVGKYIGDVDHAFTKTTLAQTIGMPFDGVFKPIEGKELLSQLTERLKNGEDPEDIFDNIYSFNEGFAKVELNRKYNLINQRGEFITEQWFDDIYGFSDGFSMVELNRKYNFINRRGEIITEQWFDDAIPFIEGFAKVKLNRKYNFINQRGEFITEQWFDYASYFREGFARVMIQEKEYYINRRGQIFDPNSNKRQSGDDFR